MIFYEAPHKLCATLRDMLSAFGDRRVTLARELTKLHEQVHRTTLAQAVQYYEENPPRGEFVLIVEGARQGAPLSQAARDIAKQTGHPKGALYKAALKQRGPAGDEDL